MHFIFIFLFFFLLTISLRMCSFGIVRIMQVSVRLGASYSHSRILVLHSHYSAPKSRIAGIYSKNIFLYFQINPKFL